jgi:hypothetical protein
VAAGKVVANQRWSRFAGQFGGLAKVDSGFDYAALVCPQCGERINLRDETYLPLVATIREVIGLIKAMVRP